MTRVFDARRTLVFDAFTKPETGQAVVTGTAGLVDASLRD